MEFGDNLSEVSVTDLVNALDDEVYTKRNRGPKIKMTKNYKYISVKDNVFEFTDIMRPKLTMIKNPYQYHFQVFYSDHVEDYWTNTIGEFLQKANFTPAYLKKHMIE